ncbi:MAG: aminotransferase class V-fold PLP-dependent enzyme [Bryobacterales bacterium]
MLDLSAEQQDALWQAVVQRVRNHPAVLCERPATPKLDREAVRAQVAAFDFAQPLDPAEAVEQVADAMLERHVHPPHPRYFGLFNPASTEAGVAGDALTAAFNPNVAAWSHSPWATEVELHLARALGAQLGLNPSGLDGLFVSGGMEANLTAVLTALQAHFPGYRTHGLRGIPAEPVFYVSAECHHSFQRTASVTGLGTDAVRAVAVDEQLRMRPDALETAIERDRRYGFAPFLVAATAGTTNAGAIDPLAEVAEVARRYGLWSHVDAAWAGAAALLPEKRTLFSGIELADSVTLDAHKWLSAPMGAGLVLCTRPGALRAAFAVENPYMPREASGDVADLYQYGLQWSRRFHGLKLFLSLLIHGWEGYRAAIRHMFAMGDRLERGLGETGWEIVNQTPLPISCFVDAEDPSEQRSEQVRASVFESGQAWISTTRLGGSQAALRACVTNFRTQPADVDALIAALEATR